MLKGVAIMFYGYDQGVMSQVNLNPDYQTHMGINPVKGIRIVVSIISETHGE